MVYGKRGLLSEGWDHGKTFEKENPQTYLREMYPAVGVGREIVPVYLIGGGKKSG